MGTPKRERQKANRQQRLEELARQARVGKRKRTGMYLLLIPLAAVAIAGVAWLTKGGDKTPAANAGSTTTGVLDTSSPTSTVTVPLPSTIPGATITGDTPCPAADGSTARAITFAKAPSTCIDPTKTYTAVVTTNIGAYTVQLDATHAPITVNNFVVLARYHYFDSTICHRAIQGFMVQCGDPTGTGTGGPGYTIADELPTAGSYKIGSLAMANTGNPNSGSSQFFLITGAQGVALDPTYSLFGQVTDGLDTTVKSLEAISNTADGPPLQQIVIQSVTITEA